MQVHRLYRCFQAWTYFRKHPAHPYVSYQSINWCFLVCRYLTNYSVSAHRPPNYLNWRFIAWTSIIQCTEDWNGPQICINWHFRVTRYSTGSPRHALWVCWCTNWAFQPRKNIIQPFTQTHGPCLCTNWSGHTSTYSTQLSTHGYGRQLWT